jgi:outer membrane protein assembly factor BamD (BamD/ComL family)
MKKIAQFKSGLFTRYKNIWTSIKNFEKQIPVLRTFPVDSTYQKFQEIEIDSSMLNDSSYLADLQEYYREKQRADSLYAIKLQQDSVRYLANLKTADSLEVNVARLKFDLVTLFLIDYNKPDSAYNYLVEIVEKFPDKDFSERAFYTLANYYDSKGQKEKADSIFQIIYDRFTDSEISKIAAKRLGLTPRITRKDLPDLEYQEAEALVENKKYKEAIDKLYSIAEKFQKTDYGPKSLLMIGHIYENKLQQYDSAYSVYKSLKEKFPNSLYTQRINSKLIAYEGELQRRELEKKAKSDSLKQSENPDQLKKENPDLKNEGKEIQEMGEPGLKTSDQEKNVNLPDELKKEETPKKDSTKRKEESPNLIKRK